MGKKRKASHSGTVGSKSQSSEEIAATSTRYEQDETFADSQDEFFAGKDHVMLQEVLSRKRRKQIEAEDRYLEPSDEEVLGYDEDEEDTADDDLNAADEGQSDSEAEESVQDWGASKADYYDADVIETEADALEEEAEARRLQQKQLQNMTEADFGFDEAKWAQAEGNQNIEQGTVVEKLPDVAVTEDTPVIERLKILKSRYPELEPLARDYAEFQVVHDELKVAVNAAPASTKQLARKRKACQDEPERAPLSMAVMKWRALSTYMASIAMYFAMLTAPASGKSGATGPMPPGELRQHPIMQSLLRSRQTWDAIKDLQLPETPAVDEESDTPPEEMPRKSQPAEQSPDLREPILNISKPKKKSKKSKKRKDDIGEPSKKIKLRREDADEDGVFAELENLIANVKKSSATPALAPPTEEDGSDFGDEVALTAQEALEKAQRKKGLRFYTSQIAQKSNKRGAASRDAGGDADLPYKERLKDRQARLMREAEKRGGEQAQLKQRLDYQDEDEDEETARVAKEVREDAEDEDGYYQTISSKSKTRKADKAARAVAHAEAAKVGGQVYAEDVVGPDGKRGITYEISKNKGLMPRRKKEVRNPRVKKRMKYDEKLKKLGSMKQVYKGGEGKGGYGGELSGIKTNIVRSVKL